MVRDVLSAMGDAPAGRRDVMDAMDDSALSAARCGLWDGSRCGGEAARGLEK
jgi:hypothetical protein